MAEVVNLRLVRKRKAREEAQKQAAENRASFGRGKSAKVSDAANLMLDRRRLDAHRRENGGDAET
ncbi:DUF4169 family protein [Chelatococcus sambhunathii]|uniref:DUF4169 family protein n=1 Tax=Chelatococcus sambhunathii TaxID=363953 RepID=A0ABU1DBS2_9HYPH|nr:DUF4169 family protein [Chelatococcus sambhunathii]MDR4305565.1 DUF4169 family protein [Chelatococcus sambhunathii]